MMKSDLALHTMSVTELPRRQAPLCGASLSQRIIPKSDTALSFDIKCHHLTPMTFNPRLNDEFDAAWGTPRILDRRVIPTVLPVSM